MSICSGCEWAIAPLLQEDNPSIPDIKKLVDGITEVLKLVFPSGVPQIILAVLGWVLLLVILLAIIWTTLWLASKISKLLADDIGPLFYNPDQARRIRRRILFARYLRNELFRLNSQEEWGDQRFAELEATVEAEGLRTGHSFFLPWMRAAAIRREKSLSTAIASSAERLILLEGEPGAGKSVAMRHVALRMAEAAEKSKRKHQILPVYLNLKELNVSLESIDRAAIERFALSSLNRINDRDVAEFLEQEFPAGIRDGTWIFLFDSFDEIPQILSSVEPDATIQLYSNAVADFLSGLNRCRGVIASRHFRGPKQFGWPKFTILSLSEKRLNLLIQKADLVPADESKLLAGLSVAAAEMTDMSRNPMFLGLLCDFVRTNRSFPTSVHIAFSTYTEHRLTRDKNRLQQRFGLDPAQVRKCAQDVAFCMSAEPGLGLSPERSAIRTAMDRQQFSVPDEFEAALDALEFIKLARLGTPLAGESQRFTFAHRRFQEYFSTSVVLREPSRISPRSLLSDGRWRETAVVMCQLQPSPALSQLLEEAAARLANMVSPGADAQPRKTAETDAARAARFYRWPPGCLHLLGILQEGFSRRPDDLTASVRESIAKLLMPVSRFGDLGSRKYAVEVAAGASGEAFVEILRLAFQSDSEWLRGAAYRQLSHLREVPDDIAAAIRLSIVQRTLFPRPHSERVSIAAYLSRLNDSARFMFISRVMQVLFKVDLILNGIVLLMISQYLRIGWGGSVLIAFLLPAYCLFRYRAIERAIAALSGVLAAVFDWKLMIALRVALSTTPLLIPIRSSATSPVQGKSSAWRFFFTLPDNLLHGPPAAWCVVCAALYLLLWAPATMLQAADFGLSPAWTVFVTPVAVVSNMLVAIRSMFALERLWKTLGALGAVVVICLLIVLGISRITESVGRILIIALAVAAAAGTVYAVGDNVLRVWRDSRRWDRWRGQRQTSGSWLTGAEFVDTWLSFETQMFRTRFVRRVRDSSLLTIGRETILALEAAVDRLQVKPGPTDEAVRARFHGVHGPGTLSVAPFVRRRSEHAAELLDELFIMLERIQKADHGARSEAP